ncbi:MAG: 30S ribosomal protein S7 [Candidatus Omnitrophica bacterium]|nr:30S ribosomal protein S7 [Candidatus Omnitrophota bacterium]
MRRKRAEKREILPDTKYNNKLVSKFINILMLKGKKSVAQNIIYSAFNILKEKTGKGDPVEVFQKAVDNVRPLLELKSRQVGGATYQVPVEVRSERGVNIALRWIRNFAKQKKGKSMGERLAMELLDAYKGEGSSVKKKEDTHKMAEANKAFSHFRW